MQGDPLTLSLDGYIVPQQWNTTIFSTGTNRPGFQFSVLHDDNPVIGADYSATPNPGNSSRIFAVGNSRKNAAFPFFGEIGEVLMWDRALDTLEMLEVRNELRSKWM